MSFIHRDFLSPARWRWNSASKLYHRFNNVWGKEVIDGIEVYTPKLVYWSGSLRTDKPFKLFVNALGVEYAQLQNAKYKGVSNVFFKLMPNKYTYTAPEKAAIATDLNAVFTINDEFELYIHYTGESKRVLANHYVLKGGAAANSTNIKDYTIDKNAIRAELESNPLKYFANTSLDAAGVLNADLVNNIRGDNPINITAIRRTPKATPLTVVEYDEDTTHIYATLALLDNGSMFQKLGISSEMVTVDKTSDTMVWYEYSYKVKYKVVADALASSYVVNQIDLLTNAIQDSLQASNGSVALRTNHTLDTNLKEAAVQMNNVEAIGLTYQGKLRVDAVANMKRLEFMKMLGKILSTGYKKKKTKWYQKVIAIVVIVVAVVIAVASAGGLSAVSASLAAGGLGALQTAALVLAVTAASMSVGMMLYAAAFPYATDQVKMIGSAAQIVGYGAMVTGIMSAIVQSFKNYALEATRQGLMEQGAKEVTDEMVTEAMKSGFANTTMSGYVKYLFNSAVSSVQTSLSSIADKFTDFFSSMVEPGGWTNNLSSLKMADVGGWLKNLSTGLELYVKFFPQKVEGYPTAEDEQAVKENGIEPVLTAISMIDNVDALVKMDTLVKNSLGGQMTENFLVKIV